MAVTKMEKLAFTFKADRLDIVLRLMQGFQGVHINTGFESSVPHRKRAEADKQIREIEKKLQDVQAAIDILKSRESGGFLKSLTEGGEKQFDMRTFTRIVEDSDWESMLADVVTTDRLLTDNRTNRQAVNRQLSELALWEQLDANPLDFKRLDRSMALFGSVHKLHADEFAGNLAQYADEGVYCEKVTEHLDRAYFFIVHHVDSADKAAVIITEFSFTAEEYNFEFSQKKMNEKLRADEAELVSEERELNGFIEKQADYLEILTFAEDYLLNEMIVVKKSLEIFCEDDDATINGWIIADKSREFERLIKGRLPDGEYTLLFSPVRDKDLPDVPVKLKNNGVATVYERLIDMYSLPKYDEIDPTPVMTVFYLVFFGMMVADIGYGIAVFLIGLAVRRWLNVNRSTRGFMDFLYYLSFPIIGWGIVYGSFCGIRMPFRLISISVDIIPMIVLSVVMGYFHIMAGFVLHILNRLKHKDYFDMVAGGLAWFVTLLGGGLMIAAGMLAFTGDNVVFIIGSVLLGAGVFMTIVFPAVQYGKRWYMGVGKGLYALYGATSYLGDFISYARLMALGVAGGSVAVAFNTILAYLPVPVRFTLGIALALVLHGLNIFLSMLSAYVHGIRLQFIEFFGKFYTGGGKKFEPFKAAEKNVIITD